MSYCGRPEVGVRQLGQPAQSTWWVCLPLTKTVWPCSQMPASIASVDDALVLPDLHRAAMDADRLVGLRGGLGALVDEPDGEPRRASSMARVSPAGPAPTTSTSVPTLDGVAGPRRRAGDRPRRRGSDGSANLGRDGGAGCRVRRRSPRSRCRDWGSAAGAGPRRCAAVPDR